MKGAIDSKGAYLHYRTLLENDNLGQWDLWKDGKALRPTVTIRTIARYEPPRRRKRKMPDGSYQVEKLNKYVIEFVGKRKKWICGPVCQATIANIYGNNIRNWFGKTITLFVDEDVEMTVPGQGRRKVGGIRVVNTAPTEAPTDDPLDEPVDAARSEMLAEAFDEDADPDRGP